MNSAYWIKFGISTLIFCLIVFIFHLIIIF
jgi:hypothetical protein